MSKPNPALRNLCAELELTEDLLRKFIKVSDKERKSALMTSNNPRKAHLLLYSSSFVQDLPNGEESGRYMILVIEGIPVKLELVNLKRKSFDLKAKVSNMPPEIMKGSGEEFFTFLADKIASFAFENRVETSGLPLGITISFPTLSQSISTGTLVRWTKGFSCDGVINENFVEKLQGAISKIPGLEVRVCSFINDSTAVLLAAAWKTRRCRISVTVGTGTNMSYVESVKNTHSTKYKGSKPYVIINTEYGNLGLNGSLDFFRTGWDRDLDNATLQPGMNILEKMISSLYLGEFMRRVLLTAAQRGIIFRGTISDRLLTVGSFEPSYIFELAENTTNPRVARGILVKLGYPMPWAQDCVDLQYVCQAVWTRAGHLVAASLAGLIDYMRYKDVTVGVDGSLYRNHASLPDIIQSKTRELADPEIQIQFVLADDGGGLGGALAAHFSNQDRNRMKNSSTYEKNKDDFFAQFDQEHRGSKAPKSFEHSPEGSGQVGKEEQETKPQASQKSNKDSEEKGRRSSRRISSEPSGRISKAINDPPVATGESSLEKQMWDLGRRATRYVAVSAQAGVSVSDEALAKKSFQSSKITYTTSKEKTKRDKQLDAGTENTVDESKILEINENKSRKSVIKNVPKMSTTNIIRSQSIDISKSQIESEMNKKDNTDTAHKDEYESAKTNKTSVTKKQQSFTKSKKADLPENPELDNSSVKKMDTEIDSTPEANASASTNVQRQSKRWTRGKGNKSESIATARDTLENTNGALNQGSQTKIRQQKGGGTVRPPFSTSSKTGETPSQEVYMSINPINNSPFVSEKPWALESKRDNGSSRVTRSFVSSRLPSRNNRTATSFDGTDFSKTRGSFDRIRNVQDIHESDVVMESKTCNNMRGGSGNSGTQHTPIAGIPKVRKKCTNTKNSEAYKLETAGKSDSLDKEDHSSKEGINRTAGEVSQLSKAGDDKKLEYNSEASIGTTVDGQFGNVSRISTSKAESGETSKPRENKSSTRNDTTGSNTSTTI